RLPEGSVRRGGGDFDLGQDRRGERETLLFERKLSSRAVVLRPCCCRVSLVLPRAVIKSVISSRVMKDGG
ncbi:hypothetical protein A2U01_0077072, partial [Trifolium medium]|nr:hypothetical protein [Trifolium medium]